MNDLHLFWTDQQNRDLIVGLLLFCSVIPAYFSARINKFIPKIVDTLLYEREELFFDKIHQVSTSFHLAFWGRVHLFLLLIFNFFLILRNKNWGAGASIIDSSLLLGGSFLFLVLFFWARRKIYHLLGIIYISSGKLLSWKKKYILLEWLTSLSLYISSLLMISSYTFSLGLICFFFLFLLWRLSLIVITIRLLREEEIDYVLIFLYLCGHEIAPFLFLYGIVLKGNWV